LARMRVARHAVHGPRRARAVLGHEVGLQVAHAEHGLRHAASLCGSSASRSASPTALSAITTSEMARPGNKLVHGAAASRSWPSAIMLPQLGLGAGTPIPRQDSPDSSSLTRPMPTAAET